MERRTFITSTPIALAGATTLGTATPAQAQDIGDRKAVRHPETIAARQKLFGADNVDPATGLLPRDKMIASWLSNSSFALSVAGTVLYLDTFFGRVRSPIWERCRPST